MLALGPGSTLGVAHQMFLVEIIGLIGACAFALCVARHRTACRLVQSLTVGGRKPSRHEALPQATVHRGGAGIGAALSRVHHQNSSTAPNLGAAVAARSTTSGSVRAPQASASCPKLRHCRACVRCGATDHVACVPANGANRLYGCAICGAAPNRPCDAGLHG
jgi:hypothetical protein